MRIGTLYSASDKSLYDALNQKKVTNSDLRELFLSRGILVSKDSSRRELANHFARLFHDYKDYQLLAKLFGSSTQRDKQTSVRIDTKATLQNFQAGAFALKDYLEEAGAVVRVSTAQGNRLDIEVKYAKVQFNKSEFRQVTNRTALISIQEEGGGFMVHAPHTDESREWVDRIAKSVIEKTEEKLEFDEISLPPSMDAKVKTKFFTLLIRAISGLTLVDVPDVYVTKPRKSSDDDDEDGEGNPEIRIDKASLRGKGVLESDELKLLESKGFYVSRIVWSAKQELDHSDLYEFEAQFASPEDCEGFAYLPRGFYKYASVGEYNQTRTAFSADEEYRLCKLIEAAARATLAKLPGHGNG